MVTKEAPPEPTLPRTREGTFKDLGGHSGMLYFDIHGSQIRHLGIEDAPSALASLDSALGPLLKLRQGLSVAIEHAQERRLASVPWRFDDPSLGKRSCDWLKFRMDSFGPFLMRSLLGRYLIQPNTGLVAARNHPQCGRPTTTSLRSPRGVSAEVGPRLIRRSRTSLALTATA